MFNWLTDEERSSRPPRKHEVLEEGADVGRVPDQDFTALPKLQLGLHSNGIDSIFLSQQESRVMHFHEVLDHYLFGD